VPTNTTATLAVDSATNFHACYRIRLSQ